MLISKKLNTIIRILLINSLQKKPNLTFSELAREAEIAPSMAKKLALKLLTSDYAMIGRGIKGIKLSNPIKLIKAWSYCYSIRELEKAEFIAAERPQYVMVKISNAAAKAGLKYAFTLFSATEYINPYTAPSDTYIYILKADLKSWQNLLVSLNLQPAEGGGNVICLLVDESYFEGTWNSRAMPVVSLPQLYADLFSYGGRGEEAAEEIMNLINKGLNNV